MLYPIDFSKTLILKTILLNRCYPYFLNFFLPIDIKINSSIIILVSQPRCKGTAFLGIRKRLHAEKHKNRLILDMRQG
jgi:hypothetical protein